MSHQQILADYAVIRIATACAIMGGDGDPVSPDTVYRLIRAGRLESPGKGKVTTASVRAHLESQRTPVRNTPHPPLAKLAGRVPRKRGRTSH